VIALPFIVTQHSAQPFPYWVLDDFGLPETFQMLREAFPDPDPAWTLRTHLHSRKQTYSHAPSMPAGVRRPLEVLGSPTLCRALERLTGLTGLSADPLLYGGGMHVTLRKGFLDPHVDFSHHPETGKRRVLNLLWYLGPWVPGDGGEIELWQAQPWWPVARLAPVANRAIVFVTSDRSWHSVAPWRAAYPRRSLACYYYNLSPGPVIPTTQYRPRPEQLLKRLRKMVKGCLRCVMPRNS
jgi:hypothetical protein